MALIGFRRRGAGEGAGVVALLLLSLALSVPAAAAPDTAADWYRNGNDYANEHRFDMAVHAYNKAIALDPTNAWLYFARGQALALLGLHADAISDYEKAVALDPAIAPVLAGNLETSERYVYPEIPSGSLIKGYWGSGWQFLEVDNRQGTYDVVVALVQRSTGGVVTAGFVRKGYFHRFEGVVPPDSYTIYVTYGQLWNARTKQFEKDAGYLKWDLSQYFQGANGYGYTMTFVPIPSTQSWSFHGLEPIPPAEFPAL